MLLLPLALAQPFAPSYVHINLFLDANGHGDVTEKFYFPPELEANLSALSSQIGFRYIFWRSYIEDLIPHLCGEVPPEDVVLVLKKEEGVPVVILTYECSAAKKVSEDLFSVTYEVRSFHFPVVGGLMVLPDNYTVEVVIPSNAWFGEIAPEPSKREGASVVWRGPVSTGTRFSVIYTVPKVYTAPSVSEYLYNVLSDPRVSLPVVAVLVLLYLGKERIRRFLVHWVSSTSEIKKE